MSNVIKSNLEIVNEKHFNILAPIAQLIVETSTDLDKFIAIVNSSITFRDKLEIVSSKNKFIKIKY